MSYYALGIGFLALAKLRHALLGYRPKPFSVDDVEACIRYDAHIAECYLKHVAEYGATVQGADVLELGPGSDLGVGAILVQRGAWSYTGFDRYPLARRTPLVFYQWLGQRLGFTPAMSYVDYVVDEEFNLERKLPTATFDLVLSNAAFEHFDDPEGVLLQLARVVRPGGKLVAVIDLQTHSRWIRDRDPHNIYRYPEWLYRLFYFAGQPNRVTPKQYYAYCLASGWSDVLVEPLTVAQGRPTSILLCATRRDELVVSCCFPA